MRKLAIPAVVALVAAIAACQPVGQTSGNGEIGMTVRWPGATSGFRVAMIPATTTRIGIEISGEGMTSAMSASIVRSGTASTGSFVSTVPIGAKTIKATAFDSTGKALAQGQGSATVILNTKTTAIVTLAPVPDPSATPTPQPSSTTDPNAPASSDPTTTTSPVPGTTPTPTPTTSPTPDPVATATPNTTAGALATPTPTPTPGPEVQIITITNGSVPAMGGQDL